MGFLSVITTLINPKKAEFTKRLIAKRISCSENSLLASSATAGTTAYTLRSIGLELVEYAASPEATVVNILEQYWTPHIANFYTTPSFHGGPYEARNGDTQEKVSELATNRINDLAAHIEYRLTGNSRASETMPKFSSFVDYIKYRVSAEHRGNNNLSEKFGYTDDFYLYAIDESRHVFQR